MRVLLIGRGDFFNDVVSHLVEAGRIEVASYVTDADALPEGPGFAGLQVIDRWKFVFPERVHRLNERTRAPLARETLDQFVPCEEEFRAISDRFCHGSSVRERRRLFQELLYFWVDYFRQEQIDGVLFDRVPHAGWTNVVEAVARRSRCRTMFAVLTSMEDRIMFTDDFRTVTQVPESFLADLSTDEVRQRIDPDLLGRFRAPNAGLAVSRAAIDGVLNPKRERRWRKKLTGFVERVAALIREKGTWKRRLGPMNRPRSWFHVKAVRLRGEWKLRRLKSAYRMMAGTEAPPRGPLRLLRAPFPGVDPVSWTPHE